MDASSRKRKSLQRARRLSTKSIQTSAIESSVASSSQVIKDAVILDSKDPYEFVNSQSFLPNTQPSRRSLTKVQNLTDQSETSTSIGSDVVADQPSTPHSSKLICSLTDESVAVNSSKSTPKKKRSSVFFTECQRIERQNEENLKRALKASLHESLRVERKRKREVKRESQKFTSIHVEDEKLEKVEKPSKSVDIQGGHTLKHSVNVSELTQPLTDSCSVSTTILASLKQLKCTVEKVSMGIMESNETKTETKFKGQATGDLSKPPSDEIGLDTNAGDETPPFSIHVEDEKLEKVEKPSKGVDIQGGHAQGTLKHSVNVSELTQPLTDSCSVNTTILASLKQLKCTVEKVSMGTMESNETKTETKFKGQATEDLSKPPSDEIGLDTNAGDETPPLSQEDSVDSLNVGAGMEGLRNPRHFSNPTSPLSEEDSSRHSLRDLDLKETVGLISSSNVELDTLSSSLRARSLDGSPVEIMKDPSLTSDQINGSDIVADLSKKSERSFTQSRFSVLSLKRKRSKFESLPLENKTLLVPSSAKKPRTSEDVRCMILPIEVVKVTEEITQPSAQVSIECGPDVDRDRHLESFQKGEGLSLVNTVNEQTEKPERVSSPYRQLKLQSATLESPDSVQVLGFSQSNVSQDVQNNDDQLSVESQTQSIISKVAKTVLPTKPISCHPLPTMYCPKGVSPPDHTPLIVQRFNSYFHQLHDAQSRVITRLKWGDPVKMDPRINTLSLDARRNSRHSKRTMLNLKECFIDLPKRKTKFFSICKRTTSESGMCDEHEDLLEQVSNFDTSCLSKERETDRSSAVDFSEEIPLRRQLRSAGEKSKKVPRERQKDKTTRHKIGLSVFGDSTDEDTTLLHSGDAENGKYSAGDKNDSFIEADSGGYQTTDPSLDVTDSLLQESQGGREPNNNGTQSDFVEQCKNVSHSTSPRGELEDDSELDNALSSLGNKSTTPQTESRKYKKGLHRLRATPKSKGNTSAAARMILQSGKKLSSNSSYDFSIQVSIPRTELKRSSSLSKQRTRKRLNLNKEKRDSEESLDSHEFEKELASENEEEGDREGGMILIDEETTTNKSEAVKGNRSVIDLTEDTLTHPNSPISASTRSRCSRQPRHTHLAFCPSCQKQFPPAVINVHTAQCKNTGDSKDEFNEDLLYKKTDKFLNRTGNRHQTKKYQSTIDQLMDGKKDQQDVVESIIDSDSDESTFYHKTKCHEDFSSQQDHLEDLYSALEKDDAEDTTLTHTHEGSSPSPQPHGVETQLIPSETGGFIVDMSTVSSSPIKTFTKISDLQASERDQLLNQFKGHAKGRGRRARASQSTGATWDREDFNELVASRSRGNTRGRSRGRGHGNRSRGRWASKSKGHYKKRTIRPQT